jgi:hypothetical protein
MVHCGQIIGSRGGSRTLQIISELVPPQKGICSNLVLVNANLSCTLSCNKIGVHSVAAEIFPVGKCAPT